MDYLLTGYRIDVKQPADNLLFAYRLRYDFFDIARLHSKIT